MMKIRDRLRQITRDRICKLAGEVRAVHLAVIRTYLEASRRRRRTDCAPLVRRRGVPGDDCAERTVVACADVAFGVSAQHCANE